MKKLLSALIMTALSLLLLLLPLGRNYKSPLMWAYRGSEDAAVDVFILGATADWGNDGTFLSSTVLPVDREMQYGLLSMQRSLYADSCRSYAPYYRQSCLSIYYLPQEEREPYLTFSYRDTEAAFLYYLRHENNGRPFILAGYSQGADLALELMQNHFHDPTLQQNLVAAYLIGWRITEEDLADFPYLKMATGQSDTGVIVSFNSEADFVTGSVIVPEGVYTYGINPLNWRTDSTPALAAENPGYFSISMAGESRCTVPNATGCYLDPQRGTVIPTDISPEEYPPGEPVFCEGCYHNYELNLYYQSVKDNVAHRIEQYFATP